MAWTDLSPYTVGRFTAAMAELLRGNFKAIGDPWTAYTPSWTSSGTAPAVGNGTLTGAWISAGKLATVRIVLLSGTTTTYGTGVYNFTLPATFAGSQWDALGGSCVVRNQANTVSYGLAAFASGTGVASGADGAGNRLSQTAPVTPTAATAGYRLSFLLVMEAA